MCMQQLVNEVLHIHCSPKNAQFFIKEFPGFAHGNLCRFGLEYENSLKILYVPH